MDTVPGNWFLDCNNGFALAGHPVEAASGQF